MQDELKDTLDDARFLKKVHAAPKEWVQVVLDRTLKDEKGNLFEDDSYVSDEMIEALRTKGDNEG